ncbi:MAG: hypothetical protein ABJB40_09475 [Acidobacteriota bacterium]
MPTKPYDLTFEDRAKYLYVCVKADTISLDIAVQYINELMAHLRQTSATKLLFVRETPTMISAAHYSIVGSVIINMLPKTIRVALVDHSPAHRIVVGFVNAEAKEKKRDIRAFESFDKAEAWLLGNARRSTRDGRS